MTADTSPRKRRRFVVDIYTDGMDYPRDMQAIARHLAAVLPDVLRPYVRETKPATVTWKEPKR